MTDEFQRAVEQPFRLALARTREEQANSRLALRSHALWCAAVVANKPLSHYHTGRDVTGLAEEFLEWLKSDYLGGEAAREAPPNDLDLRGES